MVQAVGERCWPCERRDRAEQLPRLVLDRRTALQRAGVPADLLEPFRPPAGKWPEAWRGDPWCVFLHGPVGSGKSYLAVELLARGLAAGRRGLFVTARSLPGIVWGALDDPAPLARLRAADLLVIDDLGRGYAPGADPAVAGVILDRFDGRRPTVLTCNQGLPLPDDAVTDRIASGIVLNLSGASRRRVVRQKSAT